MKKINRFINSLHSSSATEKEGAIFHWQDSLVIILLLNVLQLILCIL